MEAAVVRGEIDERDSGGDALARLVAELGRAAHAGWGPSARWLTFFVVTAGAVALLLAMSR